MGTREEWSERQDLNLRRLGPKPSALAKLSYAPNHPPRQYPRLRPPAKPIRPAPLLLKMPLAILGLSMPARKHAAHKLKAPGPKVTHGLGIGPLQVMPVRFQAPSTVSRPILPRSQPQWRLPGYDLLSRIDRLRH